MKKVRKKLISVALAGMMLCSSLSQGMVYANHTAESDDQQKGFATFVENEEGLITYLDQSGNQIGYGKSDSSTKELEMLIQEHEVAEKATISVSDFTKNEITTVNPKKTELQLDLVETEAVQSQEAIVPESNLMKTAVDNEYVIVFSERASNTAIQSVIKNHGFEVLDSIEDAKIKLVKSKSGEISDSKIDQLNGLIAVESIEPNFMYTIQDVTEALTEAVTEEKQEIIAQESDEVTDTASMTSIETVEAIVPTSEIVTYDPTLETYYSELWGMNNIGQSVLGYQGIADMDIDASEAWVGAQGSDEVVVGVIDTGVNITHPDLINNIYTNPNEIPDNGIDDDQNGFIDDVNGWDFGNDDNTVFDLVDGDEHGTHVAGTIAASLNGIGVVGVAPKVKIMPIKFLVNGSGTTYDAIDAIYYAKQMGVKILNNSWGGGDYSQALYDAIEDCNALFVVAAGNDGINIDQAPSYPASYTCDNILSVASINNRGDLSDFSNFGKNSVDLAAPGEVILSVGAEVGQFDAAVYNVAPNFKTFFAGFGVEVLINEEQQDQFVQEVMSFFGAPSGSNVLIVDDDNSHSNQEGIVDVASYYTSAYTRSGFVPVTFETRNADTLSQTEIDSYDSVVWFTGKSVAQSEGIANINSYEQNLLMNYLDQGGNLFLSGRDAGWMISDTVFYHDYLGTQFLREENRKESIFSVSEEFTGTYQFQGELFMDYLQPIANPKGSSAAAFAYPYQGFSYSYMSGTSMASPHVAGVAALLDAIEPNLTPVEMKQKLMMTTQYNAKLNNLVQTSGIVNAKSATSTIVIEEDDEIPGVAMLFNTYGTLNSVTDKDDVYSLALVEGETIRIDLQGQQVCDFDLHLYSSTATSIEEVSDILISSEEDGAYETIYFTAPMSATYYLDVYAVSGFGDYVLNRQTVVQSSIDDRNPAIQYTGNWENLSSSQYFDRTARQLKSVGSFTYQFEGSQISLIGFKNKNQGLAEIEIDGNLHIVDLYSAEGQLNQTIFDETLEFGQHTITVRWMGQPSPNGKKTSTGINIDRIIVDSFTMIPATPIIESVTSYLNNIEFRLSNSYDGNTKEICFYKIGEGNTPELVARYNIEGIGEYTSLSLLVRSQDYVERNYYVVAVNEAGVESEPSAYILTKPLEPNAVYMVEDNNQVVRKSSGWNYEQQTDSANQSVLTTLTSGEYMMIHNAAALDSMLQFLSGPDMGVVRIVTPSGGYSYEMNLNTPYEGRRGFGHFYLGSVGNSGDWIIECVSGKVSFDYMLNQDIDHLQPESVRNLEAVSGDTGVQLSWEYTAETDLAFFRIHRTQENESMVTQDIYGGPNTPDFIPVATLAGSYLDTTVEPDKEYVYTIISYDYAGNPCSNPATVTVSTGGSTVDTEVIRYEETAGVFNGQWLTHTNASNSQRNALYSGTIGDIASLDFYGTGVSVIGLANASRGIAKITVDDMMPIMVDCYSEIAVYQKELYSIQGLEQGYHHIEIEVTGQRNSDATNKLIHIDAFDVTVVAEETQFVRHEETEGQIFGNWSVHTKPENSQSTAYISSTANDEFSYEFFGKGVNWIGMASPARGIAEVYIDGTFIERVDTYSATTEYQKLLFSKTGLTNDYHTIRIVVTGQKNSAATNKIIHIDAMDIDTVVDTNAPLAPINFYVANYNSTTVDLVWDSNTESDLAGYHLYRYDVLYDRIDDFGLLESDITSLSDIGIVVGRSYEYYLYAIDQSGNLSPRAISDRIDIPEDRTIHEYEEDFAVYTGAWLDHSNVNNSGGNAKYSSTKEDTVTIDFHGSGIVLYGLKNASRGIASIQLDGGEPILVDLYSDTPQYQAEFYRNTTLSHGKHTIVITVTGTKNPSATNKVVHLDAIDVYEYMVEQ